MNFSRENLDKYIDTVIKGQTSDLNVPVEACLVEGPVEPCTIVIFGATGDLTTRKLAPALYNLYLTGVIPDSLVIVGAARSEMTHIQFRERIKSAVNGMDMSSGKGSLNLSITRPFSLIPPILSTNFQKRYKLWKRT